MSGTDKTEFKRPESVLVLVYTLPGEVLLLKRADHPEFWQSVTGALRADETPAQAARRELAEETGLMAGPELVDTGREFRFPILPPWRDRYAADVRENLEHQFCLALAERAAIRLSPREHVAFEWLSAADAAHKVWSWTDRAAIEALSPGAG